MIICHRHKFIFLKTYKTAGTSIEIALSKFCGPEDVITPIVPEDEEIRKSLGHRGPQNYLIPFSNYSLRKAASSILHRRRHRYFNHSPASMVRHFVSGKMWNEYHKICFERNPWDRFVSAYYYSLATGSRLSISEGVDSSILRNMKIKGFEIYAPGGEIAVDRVCLYENLEEELEAFRTNVGIPERLVLPRAKANYRKDKRHYREILGDAEREKIGRVFEKEIALFGYTF